MNELAGVNFQMHHSVCSHKIYVNTPLTKNNQASMKYMKGVQAQSENEESWLCVINTSKNAPVRDTSLPQKEQPTEV